MRQRSNLFTRSRVATTRPIDLGGGQRILQSFSTFVLNSVKGSPVYCRVEVSEWSEKTDGERNSSEAHSAVSVSPGSDGDIGTFDGLLGSCAGLSDIYVVTIDVLLASCCSLSGRSDAIGGAMGICLMRSLLKSSLGVHLVLRSST